MQFALLVAAVVALLLSSFLTLTHVHSFFTIQSNEMLNLVDTVNQQLFEIIEEGSTDNDTITSTAENVIGKKHNSYYGAWQKGYVYHQLRQKKIEKCALFGSVRELNSPNLYLSNSSSPLVVVGNTRIEGNSYLPKAGVRAGTIAGNYYQGTALVYGSTRESARILPDLEPSWIQYLEYLSGNSLLEEDIIDLKEQLQHSFLEKTQLSYSREQILLTNEVLQGNLIIKSATQIIVESTATLEDVLLIAPIIKINAGFKGRIQVIATEKIEVGKNVHLQYPSAMIILDATAISAQNNTGDYSQSRIIALEIDKGTQVEGSVVYLKKKSEEAPYVGIKTNIKVDSGAVITGEVYCDGNIELLGTIKGSLYARQCIANQYGSVYLNHIYGGKVLRNTIPGYSGLPLAKSSNTIAKWMY